MRNALRILIIWLTAMNVRAQVARHEPISAPPASRDVLREGAGEREHLTGDWGGFRSRLAGEGIHFQGGYVGEVFGNLSGGLRTGAVYEGIGEYALGFDLARLTHERWTGAHLHVCALWTHGVSPSTRLAGDAMALSNIDAWDTLRLYEFWFEQALWDGAFSLRVGSLLAETESTLNGSAGLFINSQFGWPNFIALNTLNNGPGYPTPSLGLRIHWEPGPNWFVYAGVFDGDNFDSATGDPKVNAHGLSFGLGGRQGVFSLYEAGYRRHPGDDAPGLPGIYKLGAWHHSAEFEDNYRDLAGGSFIVSGLAPRRHSGLFGAYAAAEQMLWREGVSAEERTQGLTAFARFGVSPPNRAAWEWMLDWGVTYHGLLPGRDDDDLGLGLVYARVSRDVRRQQRDDRDLNGVSYPALADFEMILEVTYAISVRPWWKVQPDFQWIHHPGGSAALADAWVVGLRSLITF